MSRDLTPEEAYLLEQMNIKKGRGDLWDFMENTIITIGGKSRPLYSAERLLAEKNFHSLVACLNRLIGLIRFFHVLMGAWIS